ncbi:Phloem protein 2-like protein [Melia azedarach]|uniref:Phloem protein 2-like protein n=1 Tax=Melia azedarach TaxID=155640 RepID=A0ACC1WW68_MELAZ|nr:Phloem protein 2-like protein [Melia azedarach]
MAKASGESFVKLFARDLTITWGDDKRYWDWIKVNDPSSNELVDAAELIKVCFLDARTNFNTSILQPGTKYEVSFVIMKKENAEGWEHPVKLGFAIPNVIEEEHDEDISKLKPVNEWLEIPVGQFTASSQAGHMEIYLKGSEGLIWKKGIVLNGIIFRAKN